MTDVNVQFFSHLNGINLANNVGDMIALLDICLVNGLPLASITAATVNVNGDIELTFYAAHNCLLFQIVELSGFAPSLINAKYRIKGIPTANKLILKANLVGTTITTTGTAKLAALGYDIAYTATLKRVYRAKDPRTEHPFIRVDETVSDGTNTYTSTYAKYAMVGLVENMTGIDDYSDASKLQLPLDTADFTANWKISGTGSGVVRGWSRWYWNRDNNFLTDGTADTSSAARSTNFTLVGDKDAFYIHRNLGTRTDLSKAVVGCGLISSALAIDVVPNWFLMSNLTTNTASAASSFSNSSSVSGSQPFTNPTYSNCASVFMPKYDVSTRIRGSTTAKGVTPDQASGYSNYSPSSNVPVLEIPLRDDDGWLRGTMKHILYSGKNQSISTTTPVLADNSMYVGDNTISGNSNSVAGFLYYLGELE